MFEKRLTWFWVLLTTIAVVIVGRLAQIQVVQAAEYDRLAERILTRPVRYLSAPRGTIFDRTGAPLLSDEPTSSICIHYAILAGDDDYFLNVARAIKRRGDFPPTVSLSDIAADLRAAVPRMWTRLAELTGLSEAELAGLAAETRARVERIKAAVQRKTPTIRRIGEEDQLLPVIQDVDSDVALAVRLELEDYPWLRVTPGSRRVAHEVDALSHVLGRLGSASPERIADDPLRDDELRRLRAGDSCGVSGVERLGETSLRGQAGRVVEDFDRRVLERSEPVAGRDVYLTIDLDLQRAALALLAETVEKCTYPSGGAAVVIDVTTREVVALVSYPTYEYARFTEDYQRLRRDTRRLPLMFRAVQAQYPPGSTCKVISLIGALSEKAVSPETRFHCTGFLLPDMPDKFRCWIYNQYPGITHDMTDDPAGQNGESAIRNSCNIYFFQAGQRLGPARLCEWFARCGLGRTQGTGLIEETPGIVPTEDWLQQHQGRGYRASDAWNFAIGQGEVTATPLQAANVAATVASGFWAPVQLGYDATGEALGAPPAAAQSFDDKYLAIVRRGMWRVVNERGGTASKSVPLDRTDYVICGKTGSAQTVPRVINRRYICEWPDGRRESVIAISEEEALATFGDEPPVIVGHRAHERYPALEEGEGLPAHAWFIGYTQPAATPPGSVPTGKVYAISVIIEFGGSGGRVAGPVAKQIAEYLLGRDER